MVPIHHIIRELKSAFQTNDICLPKNAGQFHPKPKLREVDSEPVIGPYKDEEDSIASMPQPRPGRTTGDLDMTFTYRTILDKIKEGNRWSSTTTLAGPSQPSEGRTKVDDINEASTPPDRRAKRLVPREMGPRTQSGPYTWFRRPRQLLGQGGRVRRWLNIILTIVAVLFLSLGLAVGITQSNTIAVAAGIAIAAVIVLVLASQFHNG